MVNILQISSSRYQILMTLVISLIIMTTAALNMIEKKRINVFFPFFVFGLGMCLTAGFMFYGFFGVAIDVFYIFVFVSAVAIFFIIKEAGK